MFYDEIAQGAKLSLKFTKQIMEKSKHEENSLVKVLQAQAELLEKLTTRVEQLTPPASAEH